MRFPNGGRGLERLAGPPPARSSAEPSRWRTIRSGPDLWSDTQATVGDQEWLRERPARLLRAFLQQGLLFPAARFVAHPTVHGAADLAHAPQPAVIAPNHSSDIDTPLVLAALPAEWRRRTLVGAASDRFYRSLGIAVSTALWINTFPFDRGGELRGLADAVRFLRRGYNVLLYPQGTRSASALEGFRSGVSRLCIMTGAPLIPVHVGGTAVLMPKGRGLRQRGRATVSFGAPLEPAPGEHADELTARAAAAIASLAGAPSRGGRALRDR